jgi:rfaE bifunctional protein nucleotidyltransferase chain/domain
VSNKIVTIEQLSARSETLKLQGRKLVLTNGCFDLLHVGHVRYLQAARKLGDALGVALNGDDSVRLLKGEGRPLNNEADRAEVLAALGCVDYVTIFQNLRATRVIEIVRPSMYVKGGDYTTATLDSEERLALEKIGTEIRILPLVPGHSTSRLINLIQQL